MSEEMLNPTQDSTPEQSTAQSSSSEVMVVVKSKIKSVVTGVNVSSDFVGALNQEVIQLINKAKERCTANGRKTLKPQDL